MMVENSIPKVAETEVNPFGDIAKLIVRTARQAKVQAAAQPAIQNNARQQGLVDLAAHA